MRIGKGRTIEVSPASQHARTAVTSARLVGPSTATWSPGIKPCDWRAAATAHASSWICRHEIVTGPSGATDVPTNVTPCPESAARVSRSAVADDDGGKDVMAMTVLTLGVGEDDH